MKFKVWVGTVVGCLVIILILGFIKWSEITSAVEFAQSMPEYSETVEAVEVTSIRYKELTTVIGEIVVPDHVVLQNELSGVVKKVNFLSGEKVKKGDAIVELDVSAEIAKINSALAREKLATSIYKRTKELRASNAVSLEQLEKSFADLAVIKSEIHVLNSIVRQKNIKAPFNGTIGIHSIKVGEYLDPNTKIVSITGQQSYVWVDFFVPQFYQKLQLNSEITLSGINANSDKSHSSAKIIAIDDAITSNIRSRKYRAKVDISSTQLNANTAVEVSVPTTPEQIAIVVPHISVLRDMGGNYVYKLIKDDTGKVRAHRQPVEILSTNAKQSFVGSGLIEGDIVAAPGAYKLFEGILVNITPANNISDKANMNSEA
jgi:membrane fusion protein (multidrug efflux system)